MEMAINNGLYEKTIQCPVCKKEGRVKAVKKASYRVVKKDTDFMVEYSGINPSFYGVHFCNECGYAALPIYFDTLTASQINKIRKNISSKWVKNNYTEEYTVDTAINQHKLALLNAIVKDGKMSEKGLICLKLSWLCRIKQDKENERRFQEQAISAFEEAYSVENMPVAGLDEWNLLYLIGELYRRTGDKEKASIYFSQVLTSNTAPLKIKEMVRDQRELLKDMD